VVLVLNIGRKKDGLRHKILMDGFNGIVVFIKEEEQMTMNDKLNVGWG
jgi:hypothetical protein